MRSERIAIAALVAAFLLSPEPAVASGTADEQPSPRSSAEARAEREAEAARRGQKIVYNCGLPITMPARKPAKDARRGPRE